VREKALREGAPLPEEPATTSAAAPLKLTVVGKDFPETRLQICMVSGGQLYIMMLSSNASECIPKLGQCLRIHTTSAALQEAAEYLAGQVLTMVVETITFTMNFLRFIAHFAFPNGHCTNEYFLENNSPVPIFQEHCMNLD
jgi:hypothetical protein